MALKPPKLSWTEAAAIPMSALTAWQGLFEHAGVRGADDTMSKGKKIVVMAAAGGVGIWIVQLARIAGLEIAAQVGNRKNDEFVRILGASETINYKTKSLKEWTEDSGLVVVFDLVGGKTLGEVWYCVKEHGTVISIFEPLEEKRPKDLETMNVKNEFFIVEPNGQQLAKISDLVSEGRVQTVIDSIWEFDDYEKAFEKLNKGRANGKVVIKISE